MTRTPKNQRSIWMSAKRQKQQVVYRGSMDVTVTIKPPHAPTSTAAPIARYVQSRILALLLLLLLFCPCLGFKEGHGGGGYSPVNWVGGAAWGGGSKPDPVSNRSHTKNTPCHNIPKNIHKHTLLQYCTPRIYPVYIVVLQ